MNKKLKMVIPALVLAVLAGAAAWFILGRENKNKPVRVSGNIEATEVRVSFRVSGKISELLTDEGRVVQKGEVVARLDTDELEKVKNADQAGLKAAQAASNQALDDYQRLEKLFAAGAVSEQKRNSAKTAAESAQANVESFQAQLALAQTRLGFAELASPINGFVLVKSAEAGEVVQSGAAVFTIADLRDIWLTAYVNETELGRVKLNQEVEVRTDTYPGKAYSGRVSYISEESEFTPKQIQTSAERVKLVYRIKVKIDNAKQELKPGMPADGKILE